MAKTMQQTTDSEMALGTTQDTDRLLLDEGSFTLEHRECLFEASDFSLSACFAVLICLRLGNALILNFLEVLVHGRQLHFNILLVRGEFSIGLVQSSCLLGLVLDVLLLGDLLDFVFLC